VATPVTHRPELRRALGLGDLVLFNIAAVVGIRWLAAAAAAGPGSVTLWILAALFFFVPSAMAVSTLSLASPDEGGIYVWTRQSFGDWHGFLCGWCYWLSNLFYFPSLLMAGLSMAALAFGFAENQGLIIGISLALLWLALLTNLVGLDVGKWTNNIGAFSTFAAGALLVMAGLLAWIRTGPATPMHLLPRWDLDRLNFWSQIAFAFGGLELGAVMGGEIRDPRRSLPRAAWISGLSIAGFYVLGTLAMLALLPADKVNIMSGLVQAAQAAGARLGAPALAAAMIALVLAGVTGQVGAWSGGCARLPFVIGLDRYLPPVLGRLHPRWHTPHISILLQGAIATAFLVALQAGENLRTGYQLLVDMTVVAYFIPFLYLFGAAWKHGRKASAACGLLVTAMALVFSFIPPAGAASAWLFELKLAGGCALLVLAARMNFQYALKRRQDP
jgi:amino acid transporter